MKALEDAEKALELDPTYAKGYFRAAKASVLLGELAKAREYFAKVDVSFGSPVNRFWSPKLHDVLCTLLSLYVVFRP